MRLWHTALRSQWSAEDLDWSKPLGLRKSGKAGCRIAGLEPKNRPLLMAAG